MNDSLYWKNIPDVEDHWPPQRNQSAYKFFYTLLESPDFLQPLVVFFGPGPIDFSLIRFSRNAVDYLNQHQLYIMSQEPLAWYSVDQKKHSCDYYSEFDKDVCIDRIRAEELDSVQAFAETHNISSVRMLIGEGGPIKELEKVYSKIEVDSGIGFYVHEAPGRDITIPNISITKKFFAASQRFTPHRFLLACYLSNFDSNISWFFRASHQIVADINWVDLYEYIDNHFDKIFNGVDNLNQNDYWLDVSAECQTIEGSSGYYSPSFPQGPSRDLSKYCKSSFVTVVGETRFAQPFSMFSEKSFIATINKRPFILVAAPGSLALMQSFGFKTFSDWWDESYDLIECPNKRLGAIFKLIDQIDNMTIGELKLVLDDMSSVLKHNYNLQLELRRRVNS